MKTVGIIAEYNPFHNGHQYHVDKSGELTGADCIVAVMSGNFTQRGEPAILDKWIRSRIAVENGVDLVLELPFVFACNRAEYFAAGGVDILAGLGASWISFGSESGDLERLQALILDLQKHDEMISEARQGLMQAGHSYAKANELAVRDILGDQSADLLLAPNNILALEYLKRLLSWRQRGRDIKAVTVKRYGSGYFDVNEAAGFAGASQIRQMQAWEDLGRFMPKRAEKIIAEIRQKHAADSTTSPEARMQAMERLVFQLVRSEIVKSRPEDLGRIYCMGEGLAFKLKKEIIHADGLYKLVNAMVSRRYPAAFIRRLLVYVLLGIRERELPKGIYARVLAAGPKGRELLREQKKNEQAEIPVITNVNREVELCTEVKETLQYDLLAADMYNLICGRDLYKFSDRVMMPYMK